MPARKSCRRETWSWKLGAYSWQQAAGPPRGRAQVPAAAALHPAGALERAPPTENTEICCVSFRPWQKGHSGWREPITSASNGFLQSWQMYSKIGMIESGRRIPPLKKRKLLSFRYTLIISGYSGSRQNRHGARWFGTNSGNSPPCLPKIGRDKGGATFCAPARHAGGAFADHPQPLPAAA